MGVLGWMVSRVREFVLPWLLDGDDVSFQDGWITHELGHNNILGPIDVVLIYRQWFP
jgi:hypothetical protein